MPRKQPSKKYTRTIDGIKYTSSRSINMSKTSAQRDAETYRGTGRKARVIQTTSQRGNKGWGVIVARKK